MKLTWTKESPAHWDDDKQAIIGDAAEGIFDLPAYEAKAALPAEWWRVEEDGKAVAFAWLDVTWGDAEITLAVHPDHQGRGCGRFMLEHLKEEAASRGIRYLYNTVRATHPDELGVTGWFKEQGFAEHDDGVLRLALSGKSG